MLLQTGIRDLADLNSGIIGTSSKNVANERVISHVQDLAGVHLQLRDRRRHATNLIVGKDNNRSSTARGAVGDELIVDVDEVTLTKSRVTNVHELLIGLGGHTSNIAVRSFARES